MHTPGIISLVWSIGLAGVVARLTVGLPALASKPKPDLAFKNTAATVTPDFALKADKVETAVFLDAKIRANPALAANCLSEGRKWAEKEHPENVETRRSEDPSFPEWRFQRSYSFLSIVADRYVSVMRADSWSPGHGAEIDTIIWDKTARRRISIRPFFRETENSGPTLIAMQTAIIAALKAVKMKRGLNTAEDETAELESYKQRFEPNLLRIGPVSLAPSTAAEKSSGLVFHYGLYVVGGHSDGAFDAFVPWQSLKPYLTPEGIKIFGGARPKEDDDGQQ